MSIFLDLSEMERDATEVLSPTIDCVSTEVPSPTTIIDTNDDGGRCMTLPPAPPAVMVPNVTTAATPTVDCLPTKATTSPATPTVEHEDDGGPLDDAAASAASARSPSAPTEMPKPS